GLPAVLKELLPLLHGDALAVNGRTLADNVRDARCWNEDVIRPLAIPLAPEGGTVILFGNLCPDGAVLKQSAASPHLPPHRGDAARRGRRPRPTSAAATAGSSSTMCSRRTRGATSTCCAAVAPSRQRSRHARPTSDARRRYTGAWLPDGVRNRYTTEKSFRPRP